MNISDAKTQKSDITVQGIIEDKGEPRTVNTKYGETQVCDSYLKDETGERIKLTLWGDDVEKVNNGDTVSIQGAYITTFRNEVQLNIPKKNGKLEVKNSKKPDETPAQGISAPPKPKLCEYCGCKVGKCANDCECGDCKNRRMDDGLFTIDDSGDEGKSMFEQDRKNKQNHRTFFGR